MAHAILAVLALRPTKNDFVSIEATTQQGQSESKKELLEKNDLTGLQDWRLDDQKEAWELIGGIWPYIHYVGCGFE